MVIDDDDADGDDDDDDEGDDADADADADADGATDVDVVMTFAIGYKLEQIIYFITSLIDTGYNGDIIIGISASSSTATDSSTATGTVSSTDDRSTDDGRTAGRKVNKDKDKVNNSNSNNDSNNDSNNESNDNDMNKFFEYYSLHHHLIVYEIPLNCNSCTGINNTCRFKRCTVIDMYEYESNEYESNEYEYESNENENEYESNEKTTKTNSNNITTTITTNKKRKRKRKRKLLLPDSRYQRMVVIIRNEYYYEWIKIYSTNNKSKSKSKSSTSTSTSTSTRILITDCRDLFFQSNPFDKLPSTNNLVSKQLFVFDSGPSKNRQISINQSMTIEESIPDRKWIQRAYPQKYYDNYDIYNDIKLKPALCAGTTLGDQYAMLMYAKIMVYQFDTTATNIISISKKNRKNNKKGKKKSNIKNYDQAYHNVIIHKHLLQAMNTNTNTNTNTSTSTSSLESDNNNSNNNNVTNITNNINININVIIQKSGHPNSIVKTIGQEIKYRISINTPLTNISWFQNNTLLLLSGGGENQNQKQLKELILNNDGSIPSIIHQGDRHPEINKMIIQRSSKEMMKWNITAAIRMINNIDKIDNKIT